MIGEKTLGSFEVSSVSGAWVAQKAHQHLTETLLPVERSKHVFILSTRPMISF